MNRIIIIIIIILLILYFINKNNNRLNCENFEVTIQNIKTTNDIKNNLYNILTNTFPNITPGNINILLKKYNLKNNYIKICDNLKKNNTITSESLTNFIYDLGGMYWFLNLTLLINNNLELSFTYYYNIVLIKNNKNNYKINIYKLANTDTLIGLYNTSNQVKPLEYKPIANHTELTDECLTKMCYSIFDKSMFTSNRTYHTQLLKLIELNITRILMKLNKSNLNTINKDIKDQINKFPTNTVTTFNQYNDETLILLNNFIIN